MRDAVREHREVKTDKALTQSSYLPRITQNAIDLMVKLGGVYKKIQGKTTRGGGGGGEVMIP